jgi:hypothetical protein
MCPNNNLKVYVACVHCTKGLGKVWITREMGFDSFHSVEWITDLTKFYAHSLKMGTTGTKIGNSQSIFGSVPFSESA